PLSWQMAHRFFSVRSIKGAARPCARASSQPGQYALPAIRSQRRSPAAQRQQLVQGTTLSGGGRRTLCMIGFPGRRGDERRLSCPPRPCEVRGFRSRTRRRRKIAPSLLSARKVYLHDGTDTKKPARGPSLAGWFLFVLRYFPRRTQLRQAK